LNERFKSTPLNLMVKKGEHRR